MCIAAPGQGSDERERLRAYLSSGWWLVAIAAMASGCGSDTVTTTGPSQPKCQVALASPQSSIGPDGGLGTLTITTAPECPWDVSTATTWLSGWSPRSGQGSGAVQFRVAPNPLPTVRDGDIAVNDTRLRVSQQAAACRFELQPSSLTADPSGGTLQVQIAAATGCAWSLTTDSDWISIDSAAGSGNATVRLDVAPHRGGAPRVGAVAVGDARVVVTQASNGPCTYTISLAGEVAIPAGGGPGNVAVTTNAGCAWTASSGVPWITVAAGAIGTGSGTVTFHVASNTGSARSGTVTIANQTFTVTQASGATTCAYALASPGAAFPATGGTGAVPVSSGSGCAWTASSGVPWVTLTAGASGSGNGSVAFSVAANSGGARSGTLAIAGHTFTVSQAAAAASCSYTISPTSTTLPARGGTGTFAVSTGGGCTWSAVRGPDSAWIELKSPTSGTGNGSVAFQVKDHKGRDARIGTVIVAGLTFTIRQQSRD